MPRERITWNHRPDSKSEPVAPFDLHITWSGEGGIVQASFRDSDNPDEVVGAVSLNRAEINAAIKTLRRARDYAYGKDE